MLGTKDNEAEEVVPLMEIPKSNDQSSTSLPYPAVAVAPSQPKPKLSTPLIISIWIAFSTSVIIYNKYLINTLNFEYPIFLVTWHMIFAAMGTRILQHTTNLLDGINDVKMTKDMFIKSILPISILFSSSLILSNTTYLYLDSLSYIQMLKAFNPVCILLISWTFRISEPNRKLAMIVFMISSGIGLASYNELKFNFLGFIIQAAAVGFEASRLVMTEVFLKGLKMDPLVSLHYYAPVCAVINLIFLPFTEGSQPFYNLSQVGPLILLSNAFVAFFLNVAAVFLISVSGGLGLTLAGVFKDILLITASVIFFGSIVSPLQVFGYSIALGGLILYKTMASK
ncbi:TPT-domain-containing protein [Mycena floridula]|nr:TPT-domain-containing protein [Mycena floridula]